MSKKIRIIILIIAIGMFCVSAYGLITTLYQEHVANRELQRIRDAMITENPLPDYNETEQEEPGFSTISVDIDALAAINRDIIAWIYIPGAPVSYPVLQGRDNHFYLTHTFDRRHNVLGSIFMDHRNNADFEDMHTIIYGHDTRNDMMFGSLKRFKEQAYADERRYIHIIRSGEVLIYEIFAIYETLATSDTYTLQFATEEAFADYLQEMASRTIVDMGVLPGTERIITLSTCTPNNRDMRLVVQAKLVDVYDLRNI